LIGEELRKSQTQPFAMSLWKRLRGKSKPAPPSSFNKQARTELFRAAREGVLANGLWSLVEASVRQDVLCLRGVAIPPRDLPMPRRFFVDGLEIPGPPALDPSLGHIVDRFGLRDPSDRYTFKWEYSLPNPTPETVRIEFRPGSGQAISQHQDWLIRLRGGPPLPDAKRRVRVAGTSDPLFFDALGLSSLATMRHALQRYYARDFHDFDAILDWGCGCGRAARFVCDAAPGKLVGVDIDPDNIQWCAQHIPRGSFHSIRPEPPTQFANETFDLIYGISVFTHLSDPYQTMWLSELSRISKPGAILLMSIHGEIAFLRADGGLRRFLALQADGMFDYGRCADLDEVLPEQRKTASYRNVLHSRRYIYTKWSDYFDIVDVLDGAIGGNQDLVIMRSRDK
jgi:SAM-dependent methyltransferase